MPAPHVFALPHSRLDDQTRPGATVRRPQHARSRRPRRQVCTEDEGVDDDDEEDNKRDDSVATLSPAAKLNKLSRDTVAFTSLTAREHAQLRAAGLRPGQDVPPFPFPHKRLSNRGYILRDVKKELGDLKPPLAHLDRNYYEPQPYKTNRERTTLREQHVAVLTTLLHQTLQKGDYKRASRAWALLLRSGYLARDTRNRQGVAGMDLRAHGRWGIGAELLMRIPRPATENAGVTTNAGSDSPCDYSEDGFRLARQYYERLIVQYPLSSGRKGAQANTFYAAMFSMWIYEVNRRYHADQNSQRRSSPPSTTNSSRRRSDSGSSTPTSQADGESESVLLHDVESIAKRMNEVIEVPPYDKDAELLHMRAMVELWIADLANFSGNKRIEAMAKAASFFARAEQNGLELEEEARRIVASYYKDNEEDEEVVMEADNDEDRPHSDSSQY
ncbi:uncharacterized protein PV09_03007 [Verruconis gallopava]|uniref:RNA polymerase I-specific transcription initiation factor rrn11 n=1 Tax=Verruconis gallopava TaxID=253628 RepID=A0A0D2AFP9_9PEZI|nr:uncharacterized protein PV09_03007 [Verruconis gallopava]KIW05798.1 hypothetical protein PV09_03007 [Verruconis gallopava]